MSETSRKFAELRDSLHESAAAEFFLKGNLNTFPLLPDGWPCPGGIRVYGYRSEVLPTGIERHRVWSPQVVLRFDLETGDHESHRLDSERALGEVSDMGRGAGGDWRHRLRRAEVALLEVCAGVAEDERRPELQGYLDWLEAEPVFSEIARDRAPGFFDWLESSGTEP